MSARALYYSDGDDSYTVFVDEETYKFRAAVVYYDPRIPTKILQRDLPIAIQQDLEKRYYDALCSSQPKKQKRFNFVVDPWDLHARGSS